MKMIHVSLFYLVILSNFSQCSQEDCYQLQSQTGHDSVLVKGSPIILDDGIVGYVEEIQNSDKSLVAKFCLPTAIQIPKNSKVYVGFIQAFSVNGIKIVSSTESDFVSSEELLYGLSMDTIELDLSPTDTALQNKLIDIVKDVNEKHKEKKD